MRYETKENEKGRTETHATEEASVALLFLVLPMSESGIRLWITARMTSRGGGGAGRVGASAAIDSSQSWWCISAFEAKLALSNGSSPKDESMLFWCALDEGFCLWEAPTGRKMRSGWIGAMGGVRGEWQ